MDKFDNFMVAMGCIRLDIIDNIPSKRSLQIQMGSLSNWKPITKKGVSTYRFVFRRLVRFQWPKYVCGNNGYTLNRFSI